MQGIELRIIPKSVEPSEKCVPNSGQATCLPIAVKCKQGSLSNIMTVLTPEGHSFGEKVTGFSGALNSFFFPGFHISTQVYLVTWIVKGIKHSTTPQL